MSAARLHFGGEVVAAESIVANLAKRELIHRGSRRRLPLHNLLTKFLPALRSDECGVCRVELGLGDLMVAPSKLRSDETKLSGNRRGQARSGVGADGNCLLYTSDAADE